MVSMNPTNPGHGFYLPDRAADVGGVPLPGLSDTNNNNNNKAWSEGESETAALEEGGSKKVRKAYTITKSRESWTDQEHDKFLEALHLFDRDWKKIEAFVGSKTVIQIRSHAQKYFLKVQKSGTNEHVPPPRPKRKAAHPYPQKAPKIAAVVPHVAAPFQSLASLEHGYIYQPDSSTAFANPVKDSSFSSWTFKPVPPVNITPVIHDDAVFGIPTVAHNCCSSSSTETPSTTQQTANVLDHGDPGRPCRVMPDFAQVYSFLGSLFDPNSGNHLERLKQMAPINMETVLLLMRNLSINLSSSEFENHRTLLASYEGNVETKSSSHLSNLVAFSSGSLIPATG